MPAPVRCSGVEIEDAIRLNAAMMAVMVAIGGKHEALTIRNRCKMIETGNRYGIRTLGVIAVRRELTRDARHLAGDDPGRTRPCSRRAEARGGVRAVQ